MTIAPSELQRLRRVVMFHAALGLALAGLVTVLLTEPSFALEALRYYPVQILVGASVIAAVAWFGTPFAVPRTSRFSVRPLILTLTAFVAGASASCIANLLVLGDLLWSEDYASYVLSPALYLGVFGLPMALALGIVLSVSLLHEMRRPVV